MGGNEDNGNGYAAAFELVLEIQAADAGEFYVEHKTTGNLWPRGFHEFFRRGEHLGVVPRRFQKIADGVANRDVIINDVNYRAWVSHWNPASVWEW